MGQATPSMGRWSERRKKKKKKKKKKTFCERCHAMLEVIEWFFVHLCVKHIVHRIHLRLPVLLVHVSLLLHFAHGVAVLLDVNLVRSALDRQPIDLLAKLQDITFVLSQPTLHSTHSKIESTKTSRGFCTAQLGLLFHGTNLLKCLLLLLADIILQARLSVCNIPFQVAPNNGNFIEAIAQGVLRCVEALLCCCQILVGKIDAPIQGIHSLVSVTSYLCLRLFQVCFHCGDIMPDGCQ